MWSKNMLYDNKVEGNMIRANFEVVVGHVESNLFSKVYSNGERHRCGSVCETGGATYRSLLDHPLQLLWHAP